MLYHLVRKFGWAFVVHRIDRAVIVDCTSARGIREMVVVNVNNFDWRICDFTDLLVIWKVYIHLANVGHGRVKRATRINIHDFFSRHV